MLKTLAIFFILVVVLHPTPTQAKGMGDTIGAPSTQRCWVLFKGDSVISETSVAVVGKENCKTKSEAEEYQKEKIQAQAEAEREAQVKATEDVGQKQAEEVLKEQEKTIQQAKMNDLEKRVSELEAQNTSTSTQLQYGSGIQIPVVSLVAPKKTEHIVPVKNTEVKTIPTTKEEIKAAVQSTSTPLQKLPPTPLKTITWWERLFSWFKK